MTLPRLVLPIVISSVLLACSVGEEHPAVGQAQAADTSNRGNTGKDGPGSIRLYSGTYMEGQSIELTDTTLNFADIGFNDLAQSLEIDNGTWTLCEDAFFAGHCATVGPDGYHGTLDDLGLVRRISSARLEPAQDKPTDGDVTLFDQQFEVGAQFDVPAGPTFDLAPLGFNDRTRSIEINRGTWTFCEDAFFHGHCITLGPGDYGLLGADGLDQRISSIREEDPSTPIDLDDSSACGDGYCAAQAKSDDCGADDPALADAICAAKGWARAGTFETKPAPFAATVCDATGKTCFDAGTSDCHTIFTSVTCIAN